MRARIWAKHLAFFALPVLSFNCGSERPVSTSIAASVEEGPGTRLVLAEHTAFPWERVCILGPYTPDEKVDSLTGVRGAAAQGHGIRASEGIAVLMFVNEGRIAATVPHGRDRGDFGPEVIGKCYSREEANFLIRVAPPNSWGNIGPG